MKKILKIKLTLTIVLIICILSLAYTVNAFSGNLSLTSTSKLKQGEIIEVSLKVTSLDAGDGIDTIVATLEYDKNIFDQVTKNSMLPSNDWSVTGYSSESGILTVQRDEKVKTPIDVLTISLRVKENATIDDTIITLKDITITGGAEEFGGTGDIELQPINITIPKDNTNTEKPPVSNEIANEVTNEVDDTITNSTTLNLIANNTTSNITNSIVTNTNNGGTTGKLPQTGENVATYIAGISIITVIAIIAFIKYRNINV